MGDGSICWCTGGSGTGPAGSASSDGGGERPARGRAGERKKDPPVVEEKVGRDSKVVGGLEVGPVVVKRWVEGVGVERFTEGCSL